MFDMNFNRFLLDNYLCTLEGKKALAFFDKFETIVRNKKYFTFYRFLKRIYFDQDTIFSTHRDIMRLPINLSLKRVCKEKKGFYSGHTFSENIVKQQNICRKLPI